MTKKDVRPDPELFDAMSIEEQRTFIELCAEASCRTMQDMVDVEVEYQIGSFEAPAQPGWHAGAVVVGPFRMFYRMKRSAEKG